MTAKLTIEDIITEEFGPGMIIDTTTIIVAEYLLESRLATLDHEIFKADHSSDSASNRHLIKSRQLLAKKWLLVRKLASITSS